MQEKLNSSKRLNKKKVKNNKMIKGVASIAIIAIGIGVFTPSLADNFEKKITRV